MGGKVLLASIFMLTIFQKSYSQSPDRQFTLDYINKSLGKEIQTDIKGSQLVVTFYNNQGEKIREDRAPLAYLDLKVFFEEGSTLLCIPCLKNEEDCVTRTLVVQKIKRPYDRISISVQDKVQFQKLKKAFEHLIRLTSEIGYKDAVTFE